MDTPVLTNKLKIYRAIHNWTQEELARRVNVTRKTINTVEKGKYVPSTRLALKLARVFGVPVEDLFQLGGEDEIALRKTISDVGTRVD
jgi:putative transcriptional regulator